MLIKKSHKLNNTILRKYDIRGIYEKDFSNEDAYYIGRAFGSIIKRQNGIKAVVGYDGRLSSPQLFNYLSKGLSESGINVISIGVVPTPALYFAAKILEADAGLMITGSHNPKEYNGIKMTLNGRSFFDEQIINLGKICEIGDFTSGFGEINEVDVTDRYVQAICKDVKIKEDLRVIFDCGNGATGEIVEKIKTALNLKNAKILFSEIDGTFPNHHPDPTIEENVNSLREEIFNGKADIGIGFDGDGDRLVVIDSAGNMWHGDQLMFILAEDVLKNNPGAKIIADVKSSDILFNHIKELGGVSIMSKTGHSYIKESIREHGAILAGEMSGHVFFADKYYGFDDALYASLRLLEIISSSYKTSEQMYNDIPKRFSTPEIKVIVDEADKFNIVDRVAKIAKSDSPNCIDIDGVRIENEHGWMLIRASNTQNAVIVRCEGHTQESLSVLKNITKKYLIDAGCDEKSIKL